MKTMYEKLMDENGKRPTIVEAVQHLAILHENNSDIGKDLDIILKNGLSANPVRWTSTYEIFGTVIGSDEKLSRSVVQHIQRSMDKAMRNKPQGYSGYRENMTNTISGIFYPGGARTYGTGDGIDIKEKHSDDSHKGSYPSIPSAGHYMADLSVSHPEFFKGNFIDIGCGVGDKALLYSLMFKGDGRSRIYGIDHDWFPIYMANQARHAFSRMNLNCKPPEFFCADAFDYDFSKFDRVYTYVPVREKKLRDKFYIHIAKQLPVGTLWFECWGADAMYPAMKRGFEQVDSHLFEKVKQK